MLAQGHIAERDRERDRGGGEKGREGGREEKRIQSKSWPGKSSFKILQVTMFSS